MSTSAGEPLLLWPDGAPGAMGDTMEDRPRLTPCLPGGTADRPRAAIIVCPGGGYTNRAPHESRPIAEWLGSLGLAAFVLDYRVSPYRHPIPLRDAQRAIRLVRHRATEWGVDPGRVGILGFSAGGHLAVSAATLFDEPALTASDPVDRQDSRPDALVACYAVVSFVKHHHGGSMRALLGDDPPADLQRTLSLEARVTSCTPPAFIWHTADDPVVPVENALLLAGAMQHRGVPFALHIFPHGRHGVGLAVDEPHLAPWTSLCADWLAELGWRQ